MTRIQILVASVSDKPEALPEKMNIESDGIIVNQYEKYVYEDLEYKSKSTGESYDVQIFNCNEKGVGLSRNIGLLRSDHEIIQFCDDDIVLDEGYAKLIENEFDKHPEADMILFNVKAQEGRVTYHNTDYRKVGYLNYGRYPAYAIAARREKLHEAGVTFSLLFGGGAKYSNGEDSLFLRDCLKKKVRIYRTNVSIGHEEPVRESTWFKGYNDKFFYDRGVLYKYLYGMMAFPMSVRFLLKNKNEMCKEKSFSQCLKLMRRGIRMSGY